MEDKLPFILQRIDSRLLSELWCFYRDFFPTDDACLTFLFNTFRLEPTYSKEQQEEKMLAAFSNDGYVDPDDHYFIPRRMLNSVYRLVSAARDMEQIRRGKDIFKIVYLVTCVETLQNYAGYIGQKKEMLFDFFNNNTSEEDKNYIRCHFARGSQGLYEDEDSFEQFIGVINEYRNCATHEGNYWDCCFQKSNDDTPLIIVVTIDIEKYSTKNKKEHIFETTMSYQCFENIFVRNCIAFIKKYVSIENEHI